MAEEAGLPLTRDVRIGTGAALVIGNNPGQSQIDVRVEVPPGAAPLPLLVSNVPAPPRHYVPRLELMSQLERTLWGDGAAYVTGQAVASGDGGQGKTILAQAYALQYKERYPGGRFIIGCDSVSLVTALAGLLPPNADTNGLTDDQRAALVRTWLSQESRCLLILDNVADDAQWHEPAFKALLPTAPCHVLITTRAERLSGVNSVNVGRLSAPEAVALLAKFRRSAADERNSDAVRAILREIEYLAAAVAAIGAVKLLDDDDDWAGYANHLAATKLPDLSDALDAVRHETGYAGKTLVVLDYLRQRLPAGERRALDYSALLPADQIVPHWLNTLLTADATSDAATRRLDLGQKSSGRPRAPADVVSHLRDLGLVRGSDTDAALLSIHRLHRRRAAEVLLTKPSLRDALLDGIAALAETRSAAAHAALTDQSLRLELTPLVAVIASLHDAGRIGVALAAASAVATPLRELGRYGQGVELLNRFVDDEVTTLAAVGPGGAATLFSTLARTLRRLGDLPRATTLAARAVEMSESNPYVEYATLTTAYAILAAIRRDEGKLVEAKVLVEKAIHVQLEHVGPEDRTMAGRYSLLATILRRLDAPQAAKQHMERAITIHIAHMDLDHPWLAMRYSDMAMILRDLRDLRGAKESLHQAIVIWEKYYPPDHPTLAIAYSDMASLLEQLGELLEMQLFIDKAAAIFARNGGQGHPYPQETNRWHIEIDRFKARRNGDTTAKGD